MSHNTKLAIEQNHSGLIETDTEVKSYIYQQVTDFSPFVTPDTVIMVISRNPKENSLDTEIDRETIYNHRIAIVLQEEGASIEAEAYHNDIYEAIKLAKNKLIHRLSEIQEEIEENESQMDDSEALQVAKSKLLH